MVCQEKGALIFDIKQMTEILTVIHVVVCLFLVVIVLLQHGKGADVGATFGGSSESLFGTEGPIPLMNKITTSAAIIFMVTSISLAYLSANKSTGSVMSDVAPKAAPDSGPVTVPMPSAPEQSAPQPAETASEKVPSKE